MVYGIHAVQARLAAAPPLVERVYLRAPPSDRLAALATAAARAGIPTDRVTADRLRALCGSDAHQGVVAEVPPFRFAELDTVLSDATERILVLDQLNDPQNFGALLRTAEAAGIACVIIPRDGSVGVTAAVEKAAAGSAVRVPIVAVVNLARTLEGLKRAGFWTIGLTADAAFDLYRYDPPARLALVLGGEAGLRRLVHDTCDVLLAIPMRGAVESLNASVAGALAMFALRPRHGSIRA
jgi:23S rRNA (guanosine2251-2'-O)-methyltransferase